jgi:radical SAM superfamily enzyme YgiQ (UPF0313 family)
MTFNDKCEIVLTADRTLMSEYAGGIFLGFSATISRGVLPDRIYFSLLCPSVDVDDEGLVEAAPCGTRKIEAALLNYGFRREDVVVAHPDYLDRVVGRRTKVVAITEFDPLGMGPATSTFTQLMGGEAYMTEKFKEILNHSSVKRFKPKIVVGGPGAWQLEDERVAGELGVDHVVLGEGENVVGPLFEKLVEGTEAPRIVHGGVVSEDEMPTIRGPTIHGIVEIARGCGRGCDFCMPNLQRYRCLPIDHILKEVEVNLRAGRKPLLHAEDVLRYKAKGFKVNKEAVANLFATVRKYPGVEGLSISHFSLSSVASAPDLIEEISQILGVGEDTPWLSGQTGIETGSPKLMRSHMYGKCKPFAPEEWPDIVVDAFDILSRNRWVPCATLIIGLPKEDDKDVDLTIQLVERLREFKSLIVPLFFVAEGALAGKAESFTLERMNRIHGELFVKCWKHDLKWIPTLLEEYSDMCIDNGLKRYGLRFVARIGIRNAGRVFSICEDEYDYDLAQMIKDIRAGKMRIAPQPLRIIHQLQHMTRTGTN